MAEQIGPPAVGKMTKGQELEKLSGYKLFHNHVTIEMVVPFFSYGTPEGRPEEFKTIATHERVPDFNHMGH